MLLENFLQMYNEAYINGENLKSLIETICDKNIYFVPNINANVK